MSTYLKDVQTTVESFQPINQNLAFNAQLLQTRQSKYNQGHDKMSELYGSILNSPLTREDNIKARDEFFKLVNTDIKKVAGIDLSLDSNVTASANVFKQVYDNDHLAKDMVWTKNFQNEMQRADAFKNCIDPEKCGGSYWDEGVEYMNHKRAEYAKADQSDALNFENAEFIPYTNVLEKAMGAAKEAGLSMTVDELSGNYMVTTKNGDQLISPLTNLFAGLYKDNPNMQKQFEIKSYLNRKNAILGSVANGQYATEEEATAGYITEFSNRFAEQLSLLTNETTVDYNAITSELNQLYDKANNGKITEGSNDHKRMMSLQQLQPLAAQAKAYSEQSEAAIKNTHNSRNLRSIGEQLDKASGAVLLSNEIKNAATVLSKKDYEVSMKADEFAKMRVANGYAVAMENLKYKHDIAKEQFKIDNKHTSYGGSASEIPVTVAGNIKDQFAKSTKGTEDKTLMEQVDKDFPLMDKNGLAVAGITQYSSGEERKKYEEVIATQLPLARKREARLTRLRAERLDEIYKEDGLESNFRAQFYADYKKKGQAIAEKGKPVSDGIAVNNILAGAGVGSYDPITIARQNISVKGGKPSSKPTRLSPEQSGDDDVEVLAQYHPDPEIRKYYTGVLKREGIAKANSWIKDPVKRKEADAELKVKIASRINQMNASEWQSTDDAVTYNVKTGKQGGYSRTRSNSILGSAFASETEGAAAHVLLTNISEADKSRNASANTINQKYLKDLDEKSPEFKDMVNYVNGYIKKHGTIKAAYSSEVMYGGAAVGYMERTDPSGLKNRRPGGSPNTQDKEVAFVGGSGITTKEGLKAFLDKNPYLSNSLYRDRVRKLGPTSDNSYFKSKEFKEEHSKYVTSTETSKGLHKDAASKHESIVKSVYATLSNTDDYGHMSKASVESFIKNGVFTGKGLEGQAYYTAKKAYNEAIDKAYIEQMYKGTYQAGIGYEVKKTMQIFDVDLDSPDPNDAAKDIRNFLKEAQGAKEHLGTADFSNNVNPEVIQDFIDGTIDIRKIEYNPVGGKAPNMKYGNLTKDFSSMIITSENGTKYGIYLDNQKHKTGLYSKVMNTPKGNLINIAGSYEVETFGKPGVLTNNKPVVIKKTDENNLTIEGEIYRWDPESKKGVYEDLGEQLAKAPYIPSPEGVEQWLEIVKEISQKMYDANNPKVKLR